MKFKNLTIIALATLAVTTQIASAGEQAKRQMGWDNYQYFQNSGKATTQANIKKNSNYDFAARPDQRATQRNDQYFQKVGYKGGEVKPVNHMTDVSQYPFTGSVLSAERGGYVYSTGKKR